MCCHINFTGALAESNRLTKVSGVMKAFGTIMSAYRGEVSKYNSPLILYQCMIELSSSAKAPTTWMIELKMLAWKPAYPTTMQRYASAYITKNNGLLGRYTDNKIHTRKCPHKKHKKMPVTNNDLIISYSRVSYLSNIHLLYIMYVL